MHCFISYRRDDTEGYAGWLADLLRSGGNGRPPVTVFLDVDDIAPGENFVRDMVQAVQEADIVLVLVGPRWFRPSLGSSDDPVRIELEAALNHCVPVRLLLCEGAAFPASVILPPSLRKLSIAPAYVLKEVAFDRCVAELMHELQCEIMPKQRSLRPQSSQLLVVYADPGFWQSSTTIPIRLDGKIIGEFALGGGQGRFDIPPGRHRINVGEWLAVTPTLEFEVAPGAAVKLVIHGSALFSATRCTIEHM